MRQAATLRLGAALDEVLFGMDSRRLSISVSTTPEP
jgi:hypothetical protein